MRKNADACLRIRSEPSQNQFINECCLARAARAGNANRQRVACGAWDVKRFTMRARFRVPAFYEIDDLRERRTREEDAVDAASVHDFRIAVSDCAASAAKNSDVTGPRFLQALDNLREEFDVATVIAREPDGAHVFLNCGADDVARAAMVAEIDDLNAVADEFEIDG